MCLTQIALNPLKEELEAWVVTDACTSRTERNWEAVFDLLPGAGAEMEATSMVALGI